MVSARSIGIELVPENSRQLIPLGMEIIDAANRQLTVHHPERPEVKTVDVTEFYDDDLSTGTGKKRGRLRRIPHGSLPVRHRNDRQNDPSPS